MTMHSCSTSWDWLSEAIFKSGEWLVLECNDELFEPITYDPNGMIGKSI